MSNTTLWERDSHTEGKHLLLQEYLNAWLPIMGKWSTRLLFIDGFAGPGKYIGGESGSPLIALQCLIDHIAKDRIGAEVVYFFIEERKDRVAYLQSSIEDLRSHSNFPQNCRVFVRKGTFDLTMKELLDYIEQQHKRLAPCFVMLDPFGVSGTPLSLIQRILQNSRAEIYISFMYESINRFKEAPEFETHLDELFGCTEWRDGTNIEEPEERKKFFYGLYARQLRRAGAKYVLKFELYKGNRLIYAIFFGTQDLKGCDKMKSAMWKVAPWGDFAFRGSNTPQLSLNLSVPDYEPLKHALQTRFQKVGWVRIEEIEDFVSSDATDYHTGQLKTNTLVPMERDGLIEVDETTRKRKRTYPQHTLLRFK